MRNLEHQVDFCVVGGGLAGLCAAVAAARHGAKVALVQDRPVLGGNASSEIRMHVCGAHGENMRETGIIEEIKLSNAYRNPQHNYAIWDSVMYEFARFTPNLQLFLNCSVNEATMDGTRITSVTGWQLTNETRQTIHAKYFADCSGDSILAPLTGAEFRIGREAREEFDEDIAPVEADRRTMGLSCLIQFRETDQPQPFTPPTWAYRYETDEDIPGVSYRGHIIQNTNYWWLEVGGEQDSIHDTEELRDELLKIAFGIVDHIKNHGDHGAENWRLEWMGFLPGKRESRRYVGDHILTQNDVRAEGHFPDLVAYGGWSMDDHNPAGFYHPGYPTIFHPAPSPYGIPYRSLYSRNIDNLFFAGRNISATHAAMSSTRVMSTCSILGQAVGTAAGIAVRDQTSPRGVYTDHLAELQQTLMDDDCYLPWHTRAISPLAQQAQLTANAGDPEPLRNGIDRPVGDEDNGWTGKIGDSITYTFAQPTTISGVRITGDSTLSANGLNIPFAIPLNLPPAAVPPTVLKAFRLEACDGNGQWHEIYREANNYLRLIRVPLDIQATAIRLVPEETWGAPDVHLLAFEVK
ncbi:MAG TPA: FAD-dependent oxidoreductase [Armatimonadota bacterium]|nr:FAD-dependent oxidoreductase [Armatimonadota bacterium]